MPIYNIYQYNPEGIEWDILLYHKTEYTHDELKKIVNNIIYELRKKEWEESEQNEIEWSKETFGDDWERHYNLSKKLAGMINLYDVEEYLIEHYG